MSSAKVGTQLPFRRMCGPRNALRIHNQAARSGSAQGAFRSLMRGHQRMSLAVQAHVSPATLPGTKKDFPIKEAEIIELAKKYSASPSRPVGADDDSILADDFRFEFPLVKLDKQSYLKAVRTFDFYAGVPNMASNQYDYRVDKYEPQRVWWTVRVSGTHTGTFEVFGRKFKPTGRPVLGAPECMSLTFNEQGKITSLTGGYVIDNRLGTCNNLGGLYGVLSSMGIFVPHPQSGTLGWKVGVAVDTGVNFVKQTLHFFTFGVFREKPKMA